MFTLKCIGQLYVSKYFKVDAKERALRIVEKVRDALRERLEEVVWMSDLTRVEAMKKMEVYTYMYMYIYRYLYTYVFPSIP
jgi:putative endopeptidase